MPLYTCLKNIEDKKQNLSEATVQPPHAEGPTEASVPETELGNTSQHESEIEAVPCQQATNQGVERTKQASNTDSVAEKVSDSLQDSDHEWEPQTSAHSPASEPEVSPNECSVLNTEPGHSSTLIQEPCLENMHKKIDSECKLLTFTGPSISSKCHIIRSG
jgi:hypothetical protein